MGHSPNVTPSPRVQQPKSRSQGSNMPSLEAGMKSKERKDRSEWSWCCTRWSDFGSHRSTAGWRISRFTISCVFDTFWRSLSFEPKLSTFGFSEHWSGERVKVVQSMPTLCLSKRTSSCSWCHPVSESVRRCCTFRYEMPYSTRIESSATVHGMFRNQKFNSLSLAERWKIQSGSFKGECCCGTTLPFILHLHISIPLTCQVLNSTWCVAVFFFKGPVAKLCPPDRAAKRGEKPEEWAAVEAWIRRRLGILGGWAWWSTRASSILLIILIYDLYTYYLNLFSIFDDMDICKSTLARSLLTSSRWRRYVYIYICRILPKMHSCTFGTPRNIRTCMPANAKGLASVWHRFVVSLAWCALRLRPNWESSRGSGSEGTSGDPRYLRYPRSQGRDRIEIKMV